MPRLDYKRCRDCGRHTDEVGPLSHTRLCGECGLVRLQDALTQQIAHRGPVFQHWRRRLVASAGGVLLDESRERK